jgi:hypothetical protein
LHDCTYLYVPVCTGIDKCISTYNWYVLVRTFHGLSRYRAWRAMAVHDSILQYMTVHCSAYTNTYWYVLVCTGTSESEYKLHVCSAGFALANLQLSAPGKRWPVDWLPVQAASGKAACSCPQTIAAVGVATSGKATCSCGGDGNCCGTGG